MMRFLFAAFIIVCVVLVSASLIGHYFPSAADTAFSVGGHSITWILIGSCVIGFAAYKVVK